MAKMETGDLPAALTEDLCRLYDTEKKLADALQEMAELASDKQLKKMFVDHRDETRDQIERLDNISRSLDVDLTKAESLVTKEMVKESKMMADAAADPALRDVALAASAVKAEHFEMACYSGAIAAAGRLGFSEEKKLLKESLREEKMASRKAELALKLLLRRVGKENDGML